MVTSSLTAYVRTVIHEKSLRSAKFFVALIYFELEEDFGPLSTGVGGGPIRQGQASAFASSSAINLATDRSPYFRNSSRRRSSVNTSQRSVQVG